MSATTTTTTKPNVWEVPQTFVRETHKYWVDEKRLGEVMTVCAEELPLLVYEQSSGSLYNVDEHIDQDEDAIFKRFASEVTSIYFDSPNLSLYRERLVRSEGSNLVRVRWYGEQPKDGQVVFLELKTHHESWVYDKSAKERVEIRERDLQLLLQHDNDAWGWEYAESIAVAAKKDLGDEQLVKAAGLLLRIRDLVIQRNLRPCVRTSYTRIAFQSSRSNDLRFTMDRDIRVYDETGAPTGAWFAPDHVGKSTALIPCPVFEVKLAGKGMPSSLEALILNGAIRDGHKFSKFITGVSVLNANSLHLTALPYWASEPIFEKLYAKSDSVSLYPDQHLGDDLESDREIPRSSPIQVPWSSPIHITWSSPIQSLRRRSNERKKPIAPKNRARVEPKSYFAVERTFIQWISAALLLITVAAILDALSVSTTHATEVIMLILASAITMYALVIYFRRLYLLENAKPYGYQDHLGPIVLTLGVFFGIGTILYFSVMIERLIGNKASVLVESMSCVEHNFAGISMLEFQPSGVIVDAERDIFIIPSTTDIKGLAKNMTVGAIEELKTLAVVDRADFEAVTYGENGILYAAAERPGSSTLMAFRWPNEDRNTLELIGQWKLDEAANVEGMTYVPSTSIGGAPKLLVSADATDPLHSNVLIFELPTFFALNGTIQGRNGDALFAVNRLNEGLLSAGLDRSSSTIRSALDSSASTRISDMAEFEGILYILHDNARIIRGWNLETGVMVLEWTTPRAGSGFNKQWEGMFLERVDGIIVLHMALDTPAQIWSFYLEEKDSGFTLPSCARAF